MYLWTCWISKTFTFQRRTKGERRHTSIFTEKSSFCIIHRDLLSKYWQSWQIATEYDIFGDFTCDLAIGDSVSKTFLLIEFEDAKRNSLFVTKPGKSTPEWGPRLEHGFSQIIDWFWKINDMETSRDYSHRFGGDCDEVDIHGLLVIGRDQHLEPREKARLKWRQKHTIVHSKKIKNIRYDLWPACSWPSVSSPKISPGGKSRS
jgi:hypothetical protein